MSSFKNTFWILRWAYEMITLALFNFVVILKKCLFIKSKSGQQQLDNERFCPAQQNTAHAQPFQKQHATIPRVKGLPIFGTFFEFLAAGAAPQLHNYIDKRHRQYGCIFHERLGGTQDAIFVSSANLMRAVFLHEGQHPEHPLPEAWILYNKQYNCQRGLFFMEGEEWLHNRRILNRLLLNGNFNWIDLNVQICTEKLINKWRTECESRASLGYEVKHLEDELYRWSINVIISVMFGNSYLYDPSLQLALENFSKVVHKIFENSSALMNFPPKLAKLLNLRLWSEFEANVTKVLQQGNDIIDEFMKQSTNEDDGLYAKLKEAEVPLLVIKRIFVDLVIAAGDTTAFSSVWTLYLLSKDSELPQKLLEECYALDNYSSPLVHGFIKETLRLYPVAPFIGRYMPRDVLIGGYHIKKKSLVLLSLYTAGRDSKHFPDPLTVMPERWTFNESTGQLQAVSQAHGTLPFAIGNRSCIGRKIAISQMHHLIKEVVKTFHLSCLNSTPIEPVLRLVTVPNQPLKLLLNMRNHA
uniref:Cytochrome P450 315a1, mitochondrial n=1 Tax=Glossina austeni TaxID=7395 RepID=A0A1A9V720_GLOAU